MPLTTMMFDDCNDYRDDYNHKRHRHHFHHNDDNGVDDDDDDDDDGGAGDSIEHPLFIVVNDEDVGDNDDNHPCHLCHHHHHHNRGPSAPSYSCCPQRHSRAILELPPRTALWSFTDGASRHIAGVAQASAAAASAGLQETGTKLPARITALGRGCVTY